MEAVVPSNWKNLTIEKYDGTTDPDEHLDDKIKELIKLGHLKEFIHKPQSCRPKGRNRPKSSRGRDQEHADRSKRWRSRSRSRKREKRPLNQPKRVINTIVRGFTRGGATTSP
ncbi:hypothetical protein JHK82_052498 [Glycine max]|nr:hypothetical protein JHK84_052386 [Glycine max]KAG5085101.1 hypothetical protein JHK82_052498 [Glycine max]